MAKEKTEWGNIMELCLFCGKENHLPAQGNDYVCARCVIRIMDTPMEIRLRALEKAKRLNSIKQARALEIFIRKEDNHEQQQFQARAIPRRKPAVRVPRHRRKTTRKSQTHPKITISTYKPNPEDLL